MSKLNFKYTILFVICVLSFGFTSDAYALNLDRVKVGFLKGDYKQAIKEGEKLMGSAANDTYGLDELYYILGVSYFKDGNALRAADIFEIILKEFKRSFFREQALLGLGDIYFSKGDFAKAKAYYQQVADDPESKFKTAAIEKSAQCDNQSVLKR